MKNICRTTQAFVLCLGMSTHAVAGDLFKNITAAVYSQDGGNDNERLIRLTSHNNRDNLHLVPEFIAGLGIKKVTLVVKYKQYEARLSGNGYYEGSTAYGWRLPDWHAGGPGNDLVSVTGERDGSVDYHVPYDSESYVVLQTAFHIKIKDGEIFQPSYLRVSAIYQTENGELVDEFERSDCGESFRSGAHRLAKPACP